ncbi:MAG: hypothetical protein J4428_04750 [Candidatus Aenigmarchaeota archaeon]|nr:hypothetical protein [Candidatus Aenigmarchaeota archaeon]
MADENTGKLPFMNRAALTSLRIAPYLPANWYLLPFVRSYVDDIYGIARGVAERAGEATARRVDAIHDYITASTAFYDSMVARLEQRYEDSRQRFRDGLVSIGAFINSILDIRQQQRFAHAEAAA